MADQNLFGEAVFPTSADRDAFAQAILDFIEATQGTTEWENASAGYVAGTQIYNNLHVADSTGVGIRWSYRVPNTPEMLDGWANALGPGMAVALDYNTGQQEAV